MTRREAWEAAWDATEWIDDIVARARTAATIYRELIPERLEVATTRIAASGVKNYRRSEQ